MDVAQYILCFVASYVNISWHTSTPVRTVQLVQLVLFFVNFFFWKINVSQTYQMYATHVLYAINLRLLLANYYVNFDLAKRTNHTIFK